MDAGALAYFDQGIEFQQARDFIADLASRFAEGARAWELSRGVARNADYHRLCQLGGPVETCRPPKCTTALHTTRRQPANQSQRSILPGRSQNAVEAMDSFAFQIISPMTRTPKYTVGATRAGGRIPSLVRQRLLGHLHFLPWPWQKLQDHGRTPERAACAARPRSANDESERAPPRCDSKTGGRVLSSVMTTNRSVGPLLTGAFARASAWRRWQARQRQLHRRRRPGETPGRSNPRRRPCE